MPLRGAMDGFVFTVGRELARAPSFELSVKYCAVINASVQLSIMNTFGNR